jgi:predicted DNA-binding ribbon-helix-helix protein
MPYKSQASITIPKTLYQQLKKIAEKHGTSVSNLVCEIINEKLKSLGAET